MEYVFVDNYWTILNICAVFTKGFHLGMKLGFPCFLSYYHYVVKLVMPYLQGRGIFVTTTLARTHLAIGPRYLTNYHPNAQKKCITFLIASGYNNYKKIEI